MIKNPLVSFCVKCYNQQELIKESLGCAFAQTYRPLEIVVSDDCSTDDSWSVIEKMVADYKVNGGDISITFVRNENNLGNLKNWQKCCEVAKGELLVKADGDDISYPERTAEVVKAWLADGKRSLVVYHGAEKINAKGVVFGRCKKSVLDYGPVGAVSAYSRKLYEAFGEIVIDDRLAGDDTVYGCRAKLLGADPLWVDQVLLKYRVGSGVSSGITGYRRFMARGTEAGLLARKQTLADIDSCKIGMSAEQKASHRARVQTEMETISTQLQLWQGATFAERLAAYRRLHKTGKRCLTRFANFSAQQIIHLLLLLGRFSDPIFDAIKLAKYTLDRLRFRP